MQPMKPERKHLASGSQRRARSRKVEFGAYTVTAAIAATAAVAAVVVGSGLVLPAAAVSLGAAGLAGVKFRELKTWGDPEVTVATLARGGNVLPLGEEEGVALGTTILGNYRRQSHVVPVPQAELRGWLMATEETSRGSGNNKKVYSETVRKIPLSIQPNVNDGWLDVDFSVEVPVIDMPVTMYHDRNKVEWHINLRLSTKGFDDHQNLPLAIGPVIHPTYYSPTQR